MELQQLVTLVKTVRALTCVMTLLAQVYVLAMVLTVAIVKNNPHFYERNDANEHELKTEEERTVIWSLLKIPL